MSTPFKPIKNAKIIWHANEPVAADYNDVYFSVNNGLQESHYVFIEGNQLIKRWQALTAHCRSFTIAETGFGTGLNFLLAWRLWREYAPKTATLHFFSCEKFPLTPQDLEKALTLWPELKEFSSLLLANYPVLTPGFHSLRFDDGRVQLTLMLGDALACYQQLLVCGEDKLEKQLNPMSVNAWFLDGFAPAKNPSMWQEELLTLFGILSGQGATLATFSAAGDVKRGLEKAGFKVVRKRGYGHKRHMIVAEWMHPSQEGRRHGKYTPWHVSTPEKIVKRKAIVLGAGLSGCFTAHSLAKRGWIVTLVDAKKEVGSGASHNPQAVLFPNLSTYQSPLTNLMLHAYLFALPCYQRLLNQTRLGELSGILQLSYDKKEHIAHAGLHQWLAHYPQLGSLVNSKEASRLAGITLKTGGLFIPHSGWLNSEAVCRQLKKTPGITWVAEKNIQELIWEEEAWHVDEYSAPILILATGGKTSQFKETQHLPLKPIRGQMTGMVSNIHSAKLKIPLCAKGHILPAYEGMHFIGATYCLGITEETVSDVDDLANLNMLKEFPAQNMWSYEIVSQWAGVRATTPDYLPFVGPVADELQFNQRFASLATNSKRWIPEPGVYHKGLYVCAGFGSRGLTTIPLCAEWLAASINGEGGFLPRSLVQAISPARFLRRKIVRKS